MKALITFFFLICLSLSSLACQKPLSKDIYLFNKLIDCPTEEQMVKTCENHNLTDLGIQEGYQTFKSSDGTLFRFKMNELGNNNRVPVVEVTAKGKKKQIEKFLNTLGYQKKDKEEDRFFKGNEYSYSHLMCIVSESKEKETISLGFTKIINRL